MKITQFLKNEFRKSRIRRWKKLYDKPHSTKAQKAITALESQGKVLTEGQLKACDDYASEVLGSRDFSPWLRVYTAFQGKFKEGWIPDNYLGRVVCPAINGDFRRLSDRKTLSKRILQTEALPDLVYFIRGSWSNRQGQPIPFSEVRALCFDQNPIVFLKKDFSFQGNGVIKLTPEGFEQYDFRQAGDFVIQSPIFQHPLLEEFSPGAVATIRITTVKPPGESAKNKLTGLRIGRKGMEYIYTRDCIRVPIRIEDGSFFDIATTAAWEILEKHPDTGAIFSGKAIPNFQEAVALCEQTHDRLPHVQLIGWDVSINQEGKAQLIEWNSDEPGIIFSEAATGPHFLNLGWENIWKTYTGTR